MCGWSCLKADPTSLGQVSPVMIGAQVLQAFGWQLKTVIERFHPENPKFTQRLVENRKGNLADGAVMQARTPE